MLTVFLDAFFPHRCIGCGKLGEAICKACLPEPLLGVEGSCTYLYRYEGVVVDAIHALKFFRYSAPAEKLTAAVGDRFTGAVLVPVPSSRSAVSERGYLQTEILAGCCGGIVVNCLQKKGARKQIGRSRAERLEEPPEILLKTKVDFLECYLVDDVSTTGASLASCEKCLNEAGVTVLGSIVLAKD